MRNAKLSLRKNLCHLLCLVLLSLSKLKMSANLSIAQNSGMPLVGINLNKLQCMSRTGLKIQESRVLSLRLFQIVRVTWLLWFLFRLKDKLMRLISSMDITTNNLLSSDGANTSAPTSQFWLLTKQTLKSSMAEVVLMMVIQPMDLFLLSKLYKNKVSLILVIYKLFRLCVDHLRRWIIRHWRRLKTRLEIKR